ncbi:MAG: GGDEF domain-containing protein [Oscillospiraceae bacterium]
MNSLTNSENNQDIKVVALCVGGIDAQYQSIIIDEISKRCVQHGNVKLLLFQAFSNSYEGGSHDVGDFNIYNLINYHLIDAVIIAPMSIKCLNTINDIVKNTFENHLALISIDGFIDGAFNILLGYANAIYSLTSHLIEKHNLKKINFIGGSPDSEVSNEREDAYKKALLDHNIIVEPKRISYGWFWGTTASQCVEEYYNNYEEMPQAFVCANDSMAIGVCEQVVKMGFSVPDDVLVTGLDGIVEAMNYSPKITTARLNLVEACAIATNTIFDILFDEKEFTSDTITVDSELVFSNSCGCEPISKSMDNKLKHDLYDELDGQFCFSEYIIRMIEFVSGAPSLYETISKLKSYILALWTHKAWVCICDSYLNGNDEVEQNYIVKGYGRKMNCVFYRLNLTCNPAGVFDTYTMLPNFFEEIQDTSLPLMFAPLHYQDRAIGYIVISYDKNFESGLFKYNTMLTNISILLENSRVQSELKQTVQQLENMYIRDYMTNVYNRRGFYQQVNSLIRECIKNEAIIMVISVDLDGLKSINDLYGHKEGDNAIITIAKTLNSVAVTGEIVARFGGDEFVVSGICDNEKYAQNYVDRLNDCLNYYNQNSGKPYKIQASCGVYCTKLTDFNTSIDSLVKIADEYMYYQKQSKKYDRHR